LCDGRVEVSTTARTKTTTVVNRTCEFIRSKFFLFRVGRTEKRDERTRREERREAHKKRQKESAERISHRRSIHSFVVFDGPKKKKILRRPFLLFLVFFPLNSYVTRYRQFLLIAMRVWQRYFGRVNGTKKNTKRERNKTFHF
jgi:hypothetical protein